MASSDVVVEIRGLRELQSTIRQIALRYPNRVLSGVTLLAEEVLGKSKRRCPVRPPPDGGTLRGSGYVDVREHEVGVGYGGAASAYALSVHETPSQFDPPSWRGVQVEFSTPGTGAKFLEMSILEIVPSAPRKLERYCKITSVGSLPTRPPTGP